MLTDHGFKQELVVLEAVGSGHTTFCIDLYWGGEAVREVCLDVYVNITPALAVATPRGFC